MRIFLRRRYCAPVIVPTLLALACFARAEEVRVWTSSEGKTLKASLVSADAESAILRLEGGREAKVPLVRLSDSDRKYVVTLKETGRAFALDRLPEETPTLRQIEVAGGPRLFRTEHFEFETDQDVSTAFIAEAARVYEGTYHALNSLPHGLTLTPPQGKTHFRGRFLDARAFDAIASERVGLIPGQRVVGLYMSKEQELLVPYTSLGAKTLGNRMTLRKSSDTTTLVHEIVHQVMHDWLPLVPTWFAEGVAEYVAAVPYQTGRFEFKNAERGLKERLESQHGISDGTISDMQRPSRYFLAFAGEEDPASDRSSQGPPTSGGGTPAGLDEPPMSPDGWGGTVREYRDAMLMLYYFMHLEDPQHPGSAVASYIKLVDASMEQSGQVQAELAKFEENRIAYNEKVKEFNAALVGFREQVDAYNEKVRIYNHQVKEGILEADRIEVGAAPAEPVPPDDLVVPDAIQRAVRGGAIDLLSLVREKTEPALLQERAAPELDRAVQEGFARIGYEVRYRN